MNGQAGYDQPGWEDAVREIVRAHLGVEGAVLPVLEAVQDRFGYIAEGALELIAEGLHLTPPQVYAVATYYHEFRLGPQAAHRIALCRGPACRIGGYDALRHACEEHLGVGVGQSTPDGRFALETSGCLGICPHAPAVRVDHELLGRVTPEEIAAIVEAAGPRPTLLPDGESGLFAHPGGEEATTASPLRAGGVSSAGLPEDGR